MSVLIDNWQRQEPVDEALSAFIEGVVARAAEQTAGPRAVEVGVTLADDAQIRSLNREHRGLDCSTDVLSFPMIGYGEGEEEPLSLDTDPDTGEVLLGDIVVSLETARRQAEAYGHSFRRELGFLLVHGVLHLRGYGHEQADEALAMERKAEDVLQALGLTREA